MRREISRPAIRAMSLAVNAALAGLALAPAAALAEGDEDVAALTKPASVVEVGVENTSHGNDKYGEYNGLHKPGSNAILNFDLRGGSAWQDGGGTLRWNATGVDLGTTSRSIGAGVSDQGRWSFGINYDELRHYITDTYQTPLLGPMGGNNFTLPPTFGVVNTQTKPPAVGGVIPPYGAQGLTAAQQSNFETQDVYSERQNTTFTAGWNISRQWTAQFEFNRLQQSGAKLIAAGSDVQNKGGFASVRGENILMLMNPTHYRTDTFNLSLNWLGEKAHLSASYFGSIFRDAYSGVNFSNPFTGTAVGLATGANPGFAFPVDTLSTAPDSDFHQFGLSGGYALSPATRLAGSLSYGRNTQNTPYVNLDQMQPGGLLQTSLHGLVVVTHFDLKLTNKTTRDLTLNAGVKFNERDNQTPSGTYRFFDLGGGAETAISTPMSNRKVQFELAGDYRIDRRQTVHAGYEFETVNRWCNSYQANNAQGPGPGGNAVGYYTAASCVQVPESNEHKLLANYRLKATEDLSFTAGYTFAKRRSIVNSAFYNPMQANNQGYELPGYRAFFDASRTERAGRAGLTWQATERLTLGLSGRYADDSYDDSSLGVQNGTAWSGNLDGTFTLAEQNTVSAYATVQRRRRELLNAAWDHTAANYFLLNTQVWENTLSSQDTTLGLTARQGGLLGGKVNLTEDVSYSLARTGYSTNLQYGSAACTAVSNSGYNCGATPDISSRWLRVKLVGDYAVAKMQKVTLGLIYQRLRAEDYYYYAYQMGYTPTSMLPTNQQAPSYSARTIFATYSIAFR